MRPWENRRSLEKGIRVSLIGLCVGEFELWPKAGRGEEDERKIRRH